jgi:site-specific DNA-methyltransferase (adenine-specific)
MQYLIRLVTPKGGTILDPFNGSGSTGKAAMYENKDRNAGYKYIGIELTPEYLPISKARIDYVEQADSIQELESKSKSSGKPTTNTSTVIKLFDIPQGLK